MKLIYILMCVCVIGCASEKTSSEEKILPKRVDNSNCKEEIPSIKEGDKRPVVVCTAGHSLAYKEQGSDLAVSCICN